MRDRWKTEFDEFFGHQLSAYVGRLFAGFVSAESFLSEAEIRKTYPTESGKAPDWVVIDAKTAILIEVKVARVHRIVYATGAEAKFDECLDPIRIGLGQLFEFGRAAARRVAGLARLARCKDFIKVVVT